MSTIILSLGGSIIVPGKVDVNFLKKLKTVIEKYIKKNYRFVIFSGGGFTARKYQEAVYEICKADNEAKDWLGISATYINALLLKIIFYRHAEKEIISNPTKKVKFNKKILIAFGWKPGWSTDYDAVLLAKNLKVNTIINMTNIDYVYDKDPKKYKNAKPIKNIIWKDFRKLVGSKWKAGLCMPFDPIAAKEAEKSKLKVIILGKNLENFKNFLNNKSFRGTVIN